MGGVFIFFLFFILGFGGRTEAPSERPSEFSISVFGRFAHRLSALNGHSPFLPFSVFWCFGNVRSGQTACARTAGHWISGSPDGLSDGASCFVVCCFVALGFWKMVFVEFFYRCFTNFPSMPTCSLLTTKAWGSRMWSLRFRAVSSCLEITVNTMLVVSSV